MQNYVWDLGPLKADNSSKGFVVTFRRPLSQFLINTFIPTGSMVLVSFVSFIVPVEIIPGRMTLLVTTFLVLVNMGNSERTAAPRSESITAMDVWILSCMGFVAGALLEYAILLWLQFHKGQEKKSRLIQRCRRLDRAALTVFATAFVLYRVSRTDGLFFVNELQENWKSYLGLQYTILKP